MKKIMNHGLVFILISVMLLVMVGCSTNTPTTTPAGTTAVTTAGPTTAETTKEQKPVTLVFAHNYQADGVQGGILTKIIPDFQAANPNITIVDNAAPGETLKQKMQVEVASGTISDVVGFWASPAILAPLTDAKALIDIQSYFAASSSIKETSYDIAPLKAVASTDGKNYIIPYTTSRTFIMYNKALFAQFNLQPPKTFEEWKEVAAVFNANDIIPFATGSNQSITGHFLWTQIASQYPNGAEDTLSIAKTNKIDTPAFNTAAKYMEEMQKAGIFPKDTMAAGAAGWAGVLDTFGTGKAAMVQLATWNLGKKMLEYDVFKNNNADIMHFPKFPGSTVSNESRTIGMLQDGIGFSAKSWADADKKAAMIKFGDALLSDEAYLLMAQVPASIAKKSVDVSKVEMDPLFKKMFDFTAKMALDPYTKGLMRNGAQVTAFQNEIDKLFTGAITGEQWIQTVQKAMDANP